ncbi:MAG: DUF1294 domain-containing protein [Clostridia bacterium]|nr:DUF1294 domain-containing protein [Clostridia bacterium]
MDFLYYILAAYMIIINITAIAVTIHDKRAAKRHRWRVSENTLLLIAALSGCVSMYITMRIIHHKTKHPKFMIGIPIIFILEAAAVCFCLFHL